MADASFRFYAELNDFLPPAGRFRSLTRRFDPPAAVKDVIEAFGVPHTDVDLVVVDGEPVGFDHRLAGGERVAVYPVFEAFDISPVARLRPAPLRRPAFAADVHLGRLARHLRLLGFDTAWRRDYDDAALAALAAAEHRIVLTRDVGLLKRRAVTHGTWVRATHPAEQAVEVLRRFDLAGAARPFSRCLACNGLLAEVAKRDVERDLPPAVRAAHDDFRACGGCGRVYWRGSHHRRLEALAADLVARAGRPR